MGKARKALIIVDVQNDYFPGGTLPLWNSVGTLQQILKVVEKAKKLEMTIVLIQHVTDPDEPFDTFVKGSYGGEIHTELLEAVAGAPVVSKQSADAFRGTSLNKILDQLGVEEIFVCGMQTQNCVGLTAISKQAEKYKVSILADCCTAEAQNVHYFALSGFGERLPVEHSDKLLI